MNISESSQSKDFQNFYDSKLKISLYFFFPLFLYFVYLVFSFLKTRNSFYHFKKLSDYSFKIKIRNIIIILFCNLYEIFFYFIYDDYLSITNEIFYIFLLFSKIFFLIFIIFLIKDQNKKSLPRYFLIFWRLFSLKNSIELIDEYLCNIVIIRFKLF